MIVESAAVLVRGDADGVGSVAGVGPTTAELTAAGLMAAGDIVLVGGRWRSVESVARASGGRLHIVFVDGSEAVAERFAERYVIAAPGSAAA